MADNGASFADLVRSFTTFLTVAIHTIWDERIEPAEYRESLRALPTNAQPLYAERLGKRVPCAAAAAKRVRSCVEWVNFAWTQKRRLTVEY